MFPVVLRAYSTRSLGPRVPRRALDSTRAPAAVCYAGSSVEKVCATDSLAVDRPALVPLRIVVVAGPDRGKQLRLHQGSYSVGKADECDLVLSDGAVSRRHLFLRVRADGIQVEDLDSKNGSFFRNARFRQVLLGAGDVISIGTNDLKLVHAERPDPLPPSSSDRFGLLRGRSMAMRDVFAVLERVAKSDTHVLITGETGTGKELCAESLHAASARAGRPFVVCDLAGMPRSLLESELYGHLRGAFTGADRDRPGAFASADGGTLFLDEIGELELEVQPRLLRALEGSQIKPLGATRYQRFDLRVIAATNRDLAEECAAGRFRTDLYHRLAIVRVVLPPLRERREDIPLLVCDILGERSDQITAGAMAILCEYDWPGNIRELRNVLARASSYVRDGEALTPEVLELGGEPRGADDRAAPASNEEFHDAKKRLIASWERTYLSELVRGAQGNISRAARRAGIDRPYLHRLLKKHGLCTLDEGT